MDHIRASEKIVGQILFALLLPNCFCLLWLIGYFAVWLSG